MNNFIRYYMSKKVNMVNLTTESPSTPVSSTRTNGKLPATGASPKKFNMVNLTTGASPSTPVSSTRTKGKLPATGASPSTPVSSTRASPSTSVSSNRASASTYASVTAKGKLPATEASPSTPVPTPLATASASTRPKPGKKPTSLEEAFANIVWASNLNNEFKQYLYNNGLTPKHFLSRSEKFRNTLNKLHKIRISPNNEISNIENHLEEIITTAKGRRNFARLIYKLKRINVYKNDEELNEDDVNKLSELANSVSNKKYMELYKNTIKGNNFMSGISNQLLEKNFNVTQNEIFIKPSNNFLIPLSRNKISSTESVRVHRTRRFYDMNKNIDERIKKLIDAIARSIMNMIKYDQLGYFEGRQQIKTKEIIIDIFQIQKATLLTIKQKLQAFDPNKVYIKGVKQEFDPARNIMKNLYKVIKDLESNPYILGFYMNMMFLFKILRIYYFHQGTKSKNVLRMNLKGHMDNNILNVIKDQITQGVCYKSTNEEYNKTGKVRQTVEIKKPSNSVQAIGRSLYPQKGNKLEGTNITEKLVETNNTEKLVGTNNTEKLVETKNTKIKNLICEHQPTCNRNFTNFIEGNHATFGHAPACDHMDYIIKTILKDYFSIYDSKKGQFSYWFSFEYTKHLQVLYYLYHYRTKT